MPKIIVSEPTSDKADSVGSRRFTEDILLIQDSKAYVGEKKQLQQMCYYLFEIGYYNNLDNELISRLYLY